MAIERKFVEQNIREFKIKKFIEANISQVGLSAVQLKKTPLGDKIVIHASRPGLVVGRGGSNIQLLTRQLKEQFNLENPQIEIEEIVKPDLDADVVAERILNSLERFGSGRTKGIGHRAMSDAMNAGALGIEIIISGKIPSMRARSWRFYSGYLKKAGDLAIEGVRKSIKSVTLKSGAVGIKVSIMPPDIVLPDHITLTEQPVTEVEETTPVDKTANSAPSKPKAAQSTPSSNSSKQTSEKLNPNKTKENASGEAKVTDNKKDSVPSKPKAAQSTPSSNSSKQSEGASETSDSGAEDKQ